MNLHSHHRKLAAALALAVVASVAAVVPVQSAGAINVLPTPPGWGSNNGGYRPGSGGGQLTINCPSATSNGRVVYRNWPGCTTLWGQPFLWSNQRSFCPHTYELWRFYGTRENPTQVRTTSRVALDPCQPDRPVLVHDNHPEDSTRSPNVGDLAPYRYSSSGWERGWPTSNTVLYSGNTFRSFAYTSWPPFRRSVPFNPAAGPRSCHTLMARDPNLASYFYGGSRFDATNPFYIGKMNAWNVAFNAWGTSWSDASMEVTGWGPNKEMTIGDNGRDCSSPSDFTVATAYDATGNPIAHSRQSDIRISGYCAIPVWREHRRFTNPVRDWYEPIMPDIVPGQGTREVYHRQFAPASYDSATRSFGPGSTSPRAARSPEILNAMRWAVADEVMTRRSSWTMTPSKEGSWLPPQSAVGNDSEGWSAIVAALHSYCDFSSGDTFPTDVGAPDGDGDDTPLPGDAVKITVTVPEAGQSGGANRPETTISTRLNTGPGGATILCGPPGTSTYCPVTADGPFLQDLDLELSLTPPPGGEYTVSTQYRPDSSGRGTLGLGFYRPTEGDQTYQVAVTGTATIRGWEGSRSSRTICDPGIIGGECRSVSSTTRRQVTRPVRVEVVYERGGLVPADRFPVVGATATPTGDRQ